MRKRISSIFLALLIFLLVLSAPIKAQSTYKVEMVVAPAHRLSDHWIFVVDGSDSMRGVWDKVSEGFGEVTAFQIDEVYFAAITFDDEGMERFRDWESGSVDGLSALSIFINSRERGRRPVNSYGMRAIEMALEQSVDELTIFLITDGGFTEVCRAGGNFSIIRDGIARAQQKRVDGGLSQALICTIGIENKNYTAGNKPSDEECQGFLSSIGSQWGGGYFLVSEK